MSEPNATPNSGEGATPTDQSSFNDSALDAQDPFLSQFEFEGGEGEIDPANPAATPNPKEGEKEGQAKKPDPKSPENADDAKGDQKVEGKKGSPLVPPQNGFPAYFFKPSDAEGAKEGDKIYDVEKAMKYQALNEKRYKAPKRTFAKEPEKKPESDKSPAELRVEKKAEYIKSRRTQMGLYGECVREAISKNYPINEALEYADKVVNAALQEDLQKYELDMELEREKELDRKYEERFGNKDLEKQVSANQNAIINQIASIENLSSEEAVNKYIELLKFGQPFMDHLFDFSHPDLDTSKMTDLQYQDKVNQWFKKMVASDMNKLTFVINSIMDSVNTTLLPYHYQQAGLKNASQNSAANLGNMRGPSNINKQTIQVDDATRQEFEGLSKMTGMPVEQLLEI